MSMEREQIRVEACLFGKSGKPLTAYQEKMNTVAGDFCVRDPLLLTRKGELLELSRKKLHETYMYAKGKSRSTKLNPACREKDHPARIKIERQERQLRIETLNEQIRDSNKHITIKERRMEQAQTVQNFKLCDQLAEEVTKLKGKRHEAHSALRVLERKEKRSNQYQCKKTRKSQADQQHSVSTESSPAIVIPSDEDLPSSPVTRSQSASPETSIVTSDNAETSPDPSPFL